MAEFLVGCFLASIIWIFVVATVADPSAIKTGQQSVLNHLKPCTKEIQGDVQHIKQSGNRWVCADEKWRVAQ